MRFSLKSLLFAAMVVAIGCAALRYANTLIGSLFTTAALLMVLSGALCACLQTDERKRYWIGFTIFGAGYFLIAMYGEREADFVTRSLIVGSPSRQILLNPHLVTTRLLIHADSYMQAVREGWTSRPPITATPAAGLVLGIGDDSSAGFIAIGQALFTLCFALIGGWLGGRLGRRETRGTDH